MARRHSSQNAFSLFAFQDIITSICGIVVLITLILALDMSLTIATTVESDQYVSQDLFNRMKAELEEVNKEIQDIETNLEKAQNQTDALASLTVSELQEKIKDANETIEANEKEKDAWEKRLPLAEERFRHSLLDEAEAEKLNEEKSELEQKLKELARNAIKVKKGNYIYYNRSSDITESPWLVDISENRINAYPLGGQTQSSQQSFTGSNSDDSFLKWARGCNQSREYFVLIARPSGTKLFIKLKQELQDMGFRIGVDFMNENRSIEIVE